MTKRMTKRERQLINELKRDARIRREERAAARLPEPNDDPAADGFAAAKADNLSEKLAASEKQREKRRQILLAALANNDKNGCFTDEDRELEGYHKLSKDDAWEAICEMAFEDEWTDEDWARFGLDHPGDEEVYRVVAEAAEAEVYRLARLICGDTFEDAGRAARRHGYLKEMGRATRKLDKIEDREGLWI